MSSASARCYDCIIAGAGISGLAAAQRLTQAGRKVLILESRNRTGGRIHSVETSSGTTVGAPQGSEGGADASGSGQQRTEPSSSRSSASSSVTTSTKLIDLGASFVHGIIDNPLTELSHKVPFDLHLPSLADGSEALAAYPPEAHGKMRDGEEAARLEYLSHLVTFERLHEYAQRGGPHGLAPEPSEEDSIWSELLRQQSGNGKADKEGVWRGIDAPTRKEVLKMAGLWSGWTGAELKDVSLKYWGWEREFRGEDAVVLPGYRKLVDYHVRLIEEAGGEIRLQSKVDKVELLEEEERVSIQIIGDDQSRETFEAKYFLCSLPLGVMQQSPPHFNPPLPSRRVAALNRLGMGLLNKIVLTYPTAWWHSSSSSSPEAQAKKGSNSEWLALLGDDEDLPEDASPLERLRRGRLFGQDYSRINQSPTILFFIGPPLAQGIESLEDGVIEEVVHKRLVSCLAPKGEEDKVPSPSARHITRWLSDPHSRGSYSYFPNRISPHSSAEGGGQESREGGGPLDMLECARPLWSERLGFCGEHTEENHFASVHGPLLTGWREARRLESLLKEEEGKKEEGTGDWEVVP
ncbi:amine oxidase [Microstroma glucosiphilum]|uniref:Amine oxidase n=1 Tax=Pseudomicrostroma glucosiphilum TaxID=1684307 RepID=A0A316U4D1_9BASI|nr:amine oxidase [Pseudomicrostroma glucosiphilum]PWN20107.1 amine oxidase [Pseudomicrostroma glucosiphilum]